MCSICFTSAVRGLLLAAVPLASTGDKSSCSSWSLAVMTCSLKRDRSDVLGKADRPLT